MQNIFQPRYLTFSPALKTGGISLLLLLAGWPVLAQDAAPAAPIPPKEVFYDSTIAYVLLAVIALLAAVIYMMGNVFILAIKNRMAADKKTAEGLKALLVMGFLFLAPQLWAQNGRPAGAPTVVSETIVQIFGFVIFVEMLIIFYFGISIRNFLKAPQQAAETSTATSATASSKKSILQRNWFDRLSDMNTEEDVIKLDLGHNYDGIKELDNKVPIWWQWGFGISLVFALVYLYSYHVAESRPLQQEELKQDLAVAAAQQASFLEKSANNVDEKTVKLMGAEDIAAGKALFIKPGACATCHGENGSGIVNGAPGIGPNLTDDYWLHKGDLGGIFYSIKYGWPEKGMKSWKDDYSPIQIAQITNYVKSLVGSNPQPAKEKQGELFQEAGAPAATDSAATAQK
ncbi:MAG: hypothetical protein EAZ62_00025 [Sphingobacteriia bacterium]|nr:MAG: hypothetical protein EAZ62_00025 [Sphingobacteriia bacterium]